MFLQKTRYLVLVILLHLNEAIGYNMFQMTDLDPINELISQEDLENSRPLIKFPE
jgi:hypothetical protein